MSKADWSQKLPQPIGGLKTLADVRAHILAMEKPTPQWEAVGRLALTAAVNGDVENVALGLRMFRWQK